jgi:pilus assembly protein FimV
VRNFGLIITFCLASLALPSNSFALGLGEIEIHSFLNQPLNAEIEVISARAGEIDDLLVSLASRDSFKRAGLSRPRHLSELRFAVKKSEEGDTAVVLVTTKTAVKEPFLNFLVEADWSKGRVLREFTVLLDPPFYADSPAPTESVSQPVASEQTISSAVVPEPIVEEVTMLEEVATSDTITPIATTIPSTSGDEQTITEPIELVADDSSKLSADEIIALPTEELIARFGKPADTIDKPIALSEETESETEVEEVQTIVFDESELEIVGDLLVEKGDTLWSLASQFKDSEHSIDQVMLAIQSMNPGAFNDNNINNMRIGAVLRAPDGEQLDRLSNREAHVQVLEQNGLWDDYVARVSGSTPVSMAGDGSDGSSAVSESDKDLTDLSLLTPGDGDSDAAGTQGAGKDADALSRQLALAEEELDASKVENSELESRIAELEATLSKVQELQKMVEIEDDSLAQLQADQAAEAVEQAAAAELEAAKQAEAEQAILEQAIEAAKQEEQESVDQTLSEEEALLEKLLAEESTTEEQAGVTPPAPVIVTEPVQQPDSILDGIIPPEILDMLSGVLDILPSMDSILSDPIMLGALGGIVVLLLILVLIKRRKGSEQDDEGITVSIPDDDLFANEEELTPLHVAAEDGSGDTNINVPSAQDLEDDVSNFSPTAVIPQGEVTETAVQESAPEEQSEEQDDTLNEVDVYLAYGLYDNAEDLLTQSLEANPERADYRAKLLDTYFATKNVTKFSEQAGMLKSMGSAGDSYWNRVQAMGYEIAPDNPLYSGGKDSDISTADFGLAKPEAADFDLGAEEDSTNFSTTDFNLGEDSDEFADTQNFVETVVRDEPTPEDIENTQESPDLDDLPELDDEIDSGVAESVPSEESGDDLGELEFAFDEEEQTPEDSGDEGGMDFELPEDMDLGADDSVADSEEASIDFDMEESLDFDTGDSADEIVEESQEDKVEATALLDMVDDFDATAFEVNSSGSSGAFDDIDLGMDDTSLDDNLLDNGAADLALPDDEEDFDPTAFTSDIDEDVVDGDDGFSFDIEDDAAMDDVDIESQPAKTDTFLPGDFDDPEELMASEADLEDIGFDDIDELMLPDDVDEVGTKLDLARAFIDMGDAEGARSSLDEVLVEGNEDQKAEATDIIKHL